MIKLHLNSYLVNATGWYWKPTWLNCITWKKGAPKVYRWLFFGWTAST